MKRPVGIVGLCLLCLGAFSAEGFAKGRKVPPDRALRRKVAHHAVSASLGAALADLANEAGVTIRVDWKGLEKVGVTAKTRVAVDLEKVTWRQVLEVMLSRVSRRGHPLGWQIHSGTSWSRRIGASCCWRRAPRPRSPRPPGRRPPRGGPPPARRCAGRSCRG